ncbi:hypothetical protein RMCBS344292_10025 [Rhizopus microsporus]|nr:hypothetical protein RMCBS344292_10025 [Rhizopus microsporus]
MPRPSNNMLFVPLSGVHAMHDILERCFNAGLKITQQLCALLTVAVIQHIPALIGPTSFEDHYGDVVWKNNLWETLFNLDHIQKKRSSASQVTYSSFLIINLLKEANHVPGWITDGKPMGTW